jgi:hypothetical protein
MKSVLNKKNIDQLRNPMFLGEDLSLQRYDLIKYPKFYDLYDQQLNFFWRPQEVSLVKDISDYKNLSPEERFVFDSNLKFQTMTDSMLSRSIIQNSLNCFDKYLFPLSQTNVITLLGVFCSLQYLIAVANNVPVLLPPNIPSFFNNSLAVSRLS